MAAVLGLIVISVLLGFVWPFFLQPLHAYAATVVGWGLAMAIYVFGSNLTASADDDPDVGFWLFNSFLLLVGLSLAYLSARRRRGRVGDSGAV